MSLFLASPLFRVFPMEPGSRKPWAVCGINLEGEPVSIEAEHRSLKQALAQASRSNELYAGIKSVSPKRRKS